MNILIIGGTKFTGRHIAREALKREHQVTVFHRGNHPLGDLDAGEEILGDRNFDLEKLENRTWDAVIDMCGYLPQSVKSSAEFLQDKVAKYVFISSISAYDTDIKPNYTEEANLARLTSEQKKKFSEIDPNGEIGAADLGDMYGALKALCEEEAVKAFPKNHLIIRPGLIVGEFDFTDRWTYWVMRVARGGEVFAPNDPAGFVQFIDAKDLAKWLITLLENNQTGIYNAVNKPFDLSFGQMLQTIKEVTQSDAEFIWVSEEFMQSEDVSPWMDMPLYLPDSHSFMHSANINRALMKGLKIRSLEETVRDTFRWRRTIDEPLKAGISRKREAELLRKWHEQKST